MGNCKHCGKPAGFLRSAHRECAQRYREQQRYQKQLALKEAQEAMEAALDDIERGVIPQRFRYVGRLPFNLQKTEKLVWLFKDVEYHEIRTRTEYVGGSQGMSFRVAKGVTWRVGGFKGRRVEKSSLEYADTGLLGVTDRHLYFAGDSKRFRIHYNRLMSVDPYEDGVVAQRDAQTAKPQVFTNLDGGFVWELVTGLSQI